MTIVRMNLNDLAELGNERTFRVEYSCGVVQFPVLPLRY